MFPSGALLTFTGSGAPISLFADSIDYDFVVEPFERLEFSNPKLRAAPTAIGSLPLIVTSFGGIPIQLASTCTGDVPRPLNPDDNNINSIKQQFNIDRYTIAGAPSLGSQVDLLYSISQDHLRRLSTFQLHIEMASMELSYPALLNLQTQTYGYLTNTGLTVTSNALGGIVPRVLIQSFSPGVAYTTTSAGVLVKDWKLTFDVRTISDRAAHGAY